MYGRVSKILVKDLAMHVAVFLLHNTLKCQPNSLSYVANQHLEHLQSHTQASMSRKKSISKTWQANLPKQPQKHASVSREPTVEDVTDSESESDSDFKDSESESEEEMESDDEDIALKEIQSDAELLEFASRLQEAHDRMVIEEKAKQAAKKRKSTYSGNSDRSKRRWKLQGKRAEEAGFPSVTKFFLKQTEVPEAPRTLESQAEVNETKHGNPNVT